MTLTLPSLFRRELHCECLRQWEGPEGPAEFCGRCKVGGDQTRHATIICHVVVRHWQDLGYLIIYVTGRPCMQLQKVVSWLTRHNFPQGLVSFADGFSTDPLGHKTEYLKHLQQEHSIVVHAGYGSSKDISVYSSIGLKPDSIHIVGKMSKKLISQCNHLSEGYAAHLTQLVSPGGSRPAQGNARMVIPRASGVTGNLLQSGCRYTAE